MEIDKETLLGQIAVQKGLISQEQLEECFKDQRRGRKGKTSKDTVQSRNSLADTLIARKLITEEQLTDLLDARAKRIERLQSLAKTQQSDNLVGQLLVRHNKATQNQVNKCLEIQQNLAEQGAERIPRLGEVMVEHGYVTAETIREILRLQNKEVLICTGCNRQYNVIGVQKGRTYRCKTCGGIMLTQSLLDSLRADETTYGQEMEQ